MRLQNSEIEAIKKVTRELFGEKSNVILFGSRTDDTKKGGDIDLFIQCAGTFTHQELYHMKIMFLVRVKEIIGNRKMDVMIKGLHSGEICKTCIEEGIQL